MVNRHVFVKPPFAVVEHQGLLLEWRDGDKGREMLVTYWEDGRALTDWLTAEQVRPAKTSWPQNDDSPAHPKMSGA